MFKPIRFNELLKAVPGTAHFHHTPHARNHQSTTQSTDTTTIDSPQTIETSTHTYHIHTTDHKSKNDIAVTEVHARVKTEATTGGGTSEVLRHVHETIASVSNVEMTPPHPPREETPTYVRTHHHLINKLDSPCAICGVRKSTLNDPTANSFGAKGLETHHYPIERSLLNACDHKKVGVIFPQVKDRDTLEEFIDSEENMMVLCDIHHRHPFYGIHHLVGPDFSIQPFLFGGYQVVASSKDAEEVRKKDEQIVKAHIKDKEDLYGDPAQIARAEAHHHHTTSNQ